MDIERYDIDEPWKIYICIILYIYHMLYISYIMYISYILYILIYSKQIISTCIYSIHTGSHMKVDIGQSSASAANKKQGHFESVGKYRENHIAGYWSELGVWRVIRLGWGGGGGCSLRFFKILLAFHPSKCSWGWSGAEVYRLLKRANIKPYKI